MVLDSFMKFQTFINHFFLVLNNHSLLVHSLFNDHHLLAFLSIHLMELKSYLLLIDLKSYL